MQHRNIEFEIEICKKIFREKINVKNEIIIIQTTYGDIQFTLPNDYPEKIPSIEIFNNQNAPTKTVINYLIEQSSNLVGNYMIYSLVVIFHKYYEQYREEKKTNKSENILEISYEKVEELDMKMTEAEFQNWIQENQNESKKNAGITGKEFFLQTKKNIQNESYTEEF